MKDFFPSKQSMTENLRKKKLRFGKKLLIAVRRVKMDERNYKFCEFLCHTFCNISDNRDLF